MARTIDNISTSAADIGTKAAEIGGAAQEGITKLNEMVELVKSLQNLKIDIPANPFSNIGKIFAEKLPLIIKLLRSIINKLLQKLDICKLLNSLPLDEVRKVLDYIINLRNKAVEILTKVLQIVTSILSITSIIQVLVNVFKVILEVLPLALSAIPYPMPPAILINFTTFYVKFTDFLKQFQSILAVINGVLAATAGGLVIIINVLMSITLELFECIDRAGDAGESQGLFTKEDLENKLSPIPSFTLGPQSAKESYKGFTFTIKVEKTLDGVKQHYAVAVDSRGIEVLEGQPSYASDTTVLIGELKLIIDQQNLSGF